MMAKLLKDICEEISKYGIQDGAARKQRITFRFKDTDYNEPHFSSIVKNGTSQAFVASEPNVKGSSLILLLL